MGRRLSVSWRVAAVCEATPGATVYRAFGVDADDPTTYALATLNIEECASPHDLYDTVVWGDATFMHDLLTGTYAVSPEHEQFLADALHELGALERGHTQHNDCST